MSIKIGDKNKISNTSIIENSSITVENNSSDKTIFEKHPVIITIIISFIVGFIFLFSFWQDVIIFVEGIFGG